MDLGFGQANELVGRATANAILQTAKVQEKLIDHELDQYDSLLQDDDALDLLRERRLKQMHAVQAQRNQWKDLGHGVYSELEGIDIAKVFFDASKASERLVVHFYRPSTRFCDVYHKHLKDIAALHLETRFVKINVESSREGNQGLTYLVEKLGIHVMPTVVLIHKRKAVYHLRGFNDVGGCEDFPTAVLKHVLAEHGVLTLSEFEQDELDEHEWFEEGGVNKIKIKTIRRGHYDKEDDEN